jgi:hypothetical protein
LYKSTEEDYSNVDRDNQGILVRVVVSPSSVLDGKIKVENVRIVMNIPIMAPATRSVLIMNFGSR